MNKINLNSFYLYISTALFALSVMFTTNSVDAGCWTCVSSPANTCVATESCGMTACNDSGGTKCVPFGSICSVIPNGCESP